MRDKPKILTRRELYDLVWSKPMIKLAEEFGLSDRGLTKTCERHRVPVPPRGYWAKLSAGKKVKQAIFREVNDPQLNRIVISSSVASLPDTTRQILEQAKAERTERAKAKRTEPVQREIEDPVERPHQLLTSTARALRKAKTDEWGAIRASGAGQCGVNVHRDSAERAIAVLDRLFRQIEGRGFSIVPEGSKTRVSDGADSLTFTLTEKTRREEHVPTEKELNAYEVQKHKRERERARGGWSVFDLAPSRWDKPWPEFDTVYTGQLAISIDAWADGLRKSWADGKTQNVAMLTDQILTGMEAILSFEKARRKQREEDRRQQGILQQRRELHKKRKERHEHRLQLLTHIMDTQREAESLRAWLGRVLLDVDGESDLGRMASWVNRHLDDMERSISADVIADQIRDGRLFPEQDELQDPLGDPPEAFDHHWR